MWRVLLLACLLPAGAESPESSEPKTPPSSSVPTYTDADLARVHELRGETGVFSVPDRGATARAPRTKDRAAGAEAASSLPERERHWRAQAAAERRRTDALAERLHELRERIAERRRQAATRKPPQGRLDPAPADTRALEARAAALEARLRDEQDRFEERARREGALPGWLR
jgi:hypothetical protein